MTLKPKPKNSQQKLRRYAIPLSEEAFRKLERYSLSIGASIGQAANYVIDQWMASNGNEIVRKAEMRQRMRESKTKLQIVYRNDSN
jgi:hypothetical protein